MPNARQTSLIASPSSSRATNRRRSSITEHSFHGIDTSPGKGKGVTHVSGTICHLCLGPLPGANLGFLSLARTKLDILFTRRPRLRWEQPQTLSEVVRVFAFLANPPLSMSLASCQIRRGACWIEQATDPGRIARPSSGLRSKRWEEHDMIPASFEYHRPRSLDEAIAILASHGDDIRIVAGGHSLIPMMKLRLAQPGQLVDLQDLGELRGIDAGSTIVIGAMTTQHALITSAALAATVPILRETSLQIADPQVRYCGTLGGNVANGDPGNDMPAVMMTLDASYRIKGKAGERDVPARDFYQGAYATLLEDGQILTSVRIPAPADGHGYAYEKQKRKIGDYATAAAAVMLEMSGGACVSAAIALTNVGETPLFAKDAGDAVLGTSLDDAAIAEAARRAQAIAKPSPDGRGPADFRAHVAGVMVRRAIARARERAA